MASLFIGVALGTFAGRIAYDIFTFYFPLDL